MNTELEIIKKSTKVMGNQLHSSIAGVDKLNLMSAIQKNLEYLKENIAAEEYQTEFEDIQNTMKELLSRLSEPTFLEKFKEGVSQIVKGLQV